MRTTIQKIIETIFQKTIQSTIDAIIQTTIPSTIPKSMQTSIPSNIEAIFQTTIPSTIETTFQTTVPTIFKSTIETLFQTTIPSTIQTTISKNIQSTIEALFESTIPKTIQTTFPKAIQTTIEKTITTNIPSIIETLFKTTIPINTQSTIETLIQDKIPKTIQSEIPTTIEALFQTTIPTTIKSIIQSTIETLFQTTIPSTITTIPTIIQDTTLQTIYTILSTIIQEIIPTTINIFNTLSNTILSNITMETRNNNCSFNDTCLLENIGNNVELYNLIVNNIIKTYSNNEDKIIKGIDNIIFQITNNKNQLNILKNKTLINNQNLSLIDLAKCEDILKKEYNINPNDSLIILIQENISSDLKSSEKNIKYEVFDPYNKNKLNLSFCEGTNINLYTKITLSEKTKRMYERLKALGYDMFNINDKFYQDICTPYKTENSTDILLTDRIDYIYNNDDSQCQTNCQFSEYLLDTQYISCECSLDGKSLKNKKDKFNAKKIYESFYEVLKYSNYQVFKCYKLVFVKKIYSENIGGIIIFSYFSINIGCFICYLIKKDKSLKNEIINSRNNSNNNIKKRKNTNIIIVKNEINSVKNSEKISFPPIKKKKKITIRRSSKTTFLSKKPIDKLKLSDKEINANLSNKNDLVLQKKSYENSDISIYSKKI